jgi:hypothetical protein
MRKTALSAASLELELIVDNPFRGLDEGGLHVRA